MEQPEKIRVLIADDHAVTRAGIRTVLDETPDIVVVAEARDGNEAQQLTFDLKPDVLLLDLVMPGKKPYEIEVWVREYSPGTATLVLTGHARDAYLAKMLDAGVAGFLCKDGDLQSLIRAIRCAALGQVILSEDQILRAKRWKAVIGERWNTLSERERQVLEWMVQGVDNQTIAKFLAISLNTVRSHNHRIFEKLGVANRSEAISFVLQQGLLDV